MMSSASLPATPPVRAAGPRAPTPETPPAANAFETFVDGKAAPRGPPSRKPSQSPDRDPPSATMHPGIDVVASPPWLTSIPVAALACLIGAKPVDEGSAGAPHTSGAEAAALANGLSGACNALPFATPQRVAAPDGPPLTGVSALDPQGPRRPAPDALRHPAMAGPAKPQGGVTDQPLDDLLDDLLYERDARAEAATGSSTQRPPAETARGEPPSEAAAIGGIVSITAQTHHGAGQPVALQIADAVLQAAPGKTPETGASPATQAPPVAPDPAREKLQVLTLDLHPERLGSVQVRLRLQGGEMRVHLVVERDATARTIAVEGAHLADRLRDAGYQLAQLDVTTATRSGDAPREDGGFNGRGEPPPADRRTPRENAPRERGRQQRNGADDAHRTSRRPGDLRL